MDPKPKHPKTPKSPRQAAGESPGRVFVPAAVALKLYPHVCAGQAPNQQSNSQPLEAVALALAP